MSRHVRLFIFLALVVVVSGAGLVLARTQETYILQRGAVVSAVAVTQRGNGYNVHTVAGAVANGSSSGPGFTVSGGYPMPAPEPVFYHTYLPILRKTG